MIRIAHTLIIAGVLMGAAMPKPRADTDQHCLAGCINSGKSASVCMPQCSYNLPPVSKTTAAGALTPTPDLLTGHRVLITPLQAPDNGALLLKTHTAPVPRKSADLACVSACLHDGMQYDLCREQCIKPDCKPNEVQCLNKSAAALPNFGPGSGTK